MTTLTRKQSSAFPEVAVIRKGGAKKTINKNGRDIQVVGDDLRDHFRVVFAPGAEDISKRFVEVYKTDQPTRIRAMIPFSSVMRAWEFYSEAYNAGRLIARADENKFLTLRDPLTGEYQVINGEPFTEFHPGMKIEYDRDGKHYALPLKCTGRLKLWLPEACMIPGDPPQIRMVYFTLKTTSFYDCMNISANLRAVQELVEALPGQNGNAGGVPIILYRKEQEITWNKPDGSAQRVKKWLVQIEMDPTYVAAAFKRLSEFALTGFTPAGFLQPGQPLAVAQPESTISLAVDPEEDEGDDDEPGYDAPAGTEEGQVRSDPAQPAEEKSQVVEQPAAASDPQAIVTAAPHKDGALIRPMAPEVLRAALALKAKKIGRRVASNNQVNLVRTLIEQCFAGAGQESPEKIRHSVTAYLFGAESLKDASGAQIAALLDWLNPTQRKDSGEYLADPTAVKELTSVWTAALEAAGQQKLF